MKLTFNFRIALQELFRNKWYSLCIALALGLGIGSTSFMLSEINMMYLKSINVPDAKNIAIIVGVENDREYLMGGLTNFDAQMIKRNVKTLRHIASFEKKTFTLTSSKFSELVEGVTTSENFFRVMNVPPYMGRWLKDSEFSDGSNEAIISWRLWGKLFNKDVNILDNVIYVDANPVRIVGIMPEGFALPYDDDLWLSNLPLIESVPSGGGWNTVIGRLNQNIDTTQKEINSLASDLRNDFPESYNGKYFAIRDYSKNFSKRMGPAIAIMIAVSVATFLMCCFSVINLMGIRIVEQSREVLIKLAIGGSFVDVILCYVIEGFILTFSGLILGTTFAYFLVNTLSGSVVSGPSWWTISIGLIELSAGLTLTLMVFGLFFLGISLITLREPTSSALSSARKGGGENKHEALMERLVSLKVAASMILFVFTGMAVLALFRVVNLPYGITGNDFISAEFNIPENAYPELKDRNLYLQKLAKTLEQVDGINRVAFTGALPGSLSYHQTYASLESPSLTDTGYPQTFVIPVSNNYFDVLDVKLTEGRFFLDSDNESSRPVAIIGNHLAKKLWPNSSAAGKEFVLNPEKNGQRIYVIGVVSDLSYGPAYSELQKTYEATYLPIRQSFPSWASIQMLAATNGNPQNYVGAVKEASRAVSTSVVVSDIVPLLDRIDRNSATFKALAINYIPATIITFLMLSLGVYGVVSRVLQNKRIDTGIKMSIGATSRALLFEYFRRLFWITFVGMSLAGLLLILFIQFLVGQIEAVGENDVYWVSLGAGSIIVLIVFGSAYFPIKKLIQSEPNDLFQ